jgi:very-short-patch-repair endonuclease
LDLAAGLLLKTALDIILILVAGIDLMSMQLNKNNSTRAERMFANRLGAAKIPFKFKWLVNNREVDFIVGKYAIDIDGHLQDGDKNMMLVKNGYIPIHISNNEVKIININSYVYK